MVFLLIYCVPNQVLMRPNEYKAVFLFVVCVFLYLLIDLLLLYGHCLIFQAFIYLLYNMN